MIRRGEAISHLGGGGVKFRGSRYAAHRGVILRALTLKLCPWLDGSPPGAHKAAPSRGESAAAPSSISECATVCIGNYQLDPFRAWPSPRPLAGRLRAHRLRRYSRAPGRKSVRLIGKAPAPDGAPTPSLPTWNYQ